MTTLSTALKASYVSRCIAQCRSIANDCLTVEVMAEIACIASQTALDVEDHNGVLTWWIFHNRFGAAGLRFDDCLVPTEHDLIKLMIGYYGWQQPARPALRRVA